MEQGQTAAQDRDPEREFARLRAPRGSSLPAVHRDAPWPSPGPVSASASSPARRVPRAPPARAAVLRSPGVHAGTRPADRPPLTRAHRACHSSCRRRVAYIGAKFGSATIISCLRHSSYRVTHSLSVLASTRMRARSSPPSTAEKSLACARQVPLLDSPVVKSDAELTLAFVQIQSYRCHGWPPGSLRL